MNGQESRLTAAFRRAGHPLLMPYAVGGYPDPDACRDILRTYREAGAGLIELGIPFSDPLADGPVIQAASQVALRDGVRPADVLDLAEEAAGPRVPVVLLSYLNTILAFGPERFFERLREQGRGRVVVPDVPVEEAADLQAHGSRPRRGRDPARGSHQHRRAAGPHRGRRLGLHLLRLDHRGHRGQGRAPRRTSPSSSPACGGTPTCLWRWGSGCRTAEQAEAVAGYADGVIIGSALVDMVGQRERELALLDWGRFSKKRARRTVAGGRSRRGAAVSE